MRGEDGRAGVGGAGYPEGGLHLPTATMPVGPFPIKLPLPVPESVTDPESDMATYPTSDVPTDRRQ